MGSGYAFENSPTRTKCTRKRKQHVKCATGEECKMKTLQHEKVQLEIVLYMKRIQNENRTI